MAGAIVSASERALREIKEAGELVSQIDAALSHAKKRILHHEPAYLADVQEWAENLVACIEAATDALEEKS